MGYLHINNLYKDPRVLYFRELYAMEKIHGTSAHLQWGSDGLTFFSGGESHDRFVGLFDSDHLTQILGEKFGTPPAMTLYGEAYGGKQQGMSQTYGKDLKFVGFDVQLGSRWLNVPDAHVIFLTLGLEFVDYQRIGSNQDSINAERDRPSIQAKRNGIEEDQVREGVVLRPIFECFDVNGERLIAKHKRAEFAERGRPQGIPLDPTKIEERSIAASVALEWVNANRLDHVIDQIIRDRNDKEIDFPDIPAVVRLMLADIEREGAGEVSITKPVTKAIGARTVELFKERLRSKEITR